MLNKRGVLMWELQLQF